MEVSLLPWLSAAAIAVAMYTGAQLAGLEGLVLLCKPLPVALLALGVARAGDRPGARLLAAAMAVDAMADFVIEVQFLGGLGLFLVGHLLRIGAFTADVPALRPLRALPFLALAAGASALLVPTSGSLGLPIAAYVLAIAAMAWRAAARADGSPSGALGLAGTLLFLLSDSLLGVDRFLAPLPAAGLLVMSTYWSSQALIAASARADHPR